jgi:CHAD domain-containing protein
MAKATPVRGLTARASLRELGPRLLAARLGDVERYQPELPAEDPVHDMRVAARRLRAALRLLGLRELDQPVKALQDALGEVRDLQLQVAWLRGRDDALAGRRAALLQRAERSLQRELARWRAPRLLEAAAQAKPKGKLGGGRVRRLLRRRLERFEQRLEKALQRASPPAMHKVRISVKQLRYLFELVPFAAKQLLTELTPLQEGLGELHDVDVRIGLLRSQPMLLREQREDRARLAQLVGAELARWKKEEIAPRVRRRLS